MCVFRLLSIIFVGIGFIVAGQAQPVLAQRVPSSTVDRILGSDSDSQRVQGDLKAALENLQKETERVRKSLTNDTSRIGGNVKKIEPTVSSTQQKVVDAPKGELDTVDIYERIKLLENMYQKREVQTQKSAVPVSSNSLPVPMPPSSQQNRISPDDLERMTNFQEREGEPMPDPTPFPVEPAMQVDRVLPVPVNLFEMGISLFQTGNLPTALEAFESIDRNDITVEDSIWADYMIATCHRRLGNLDQAISVYREISNQRDDQRLKKASRAWLKQLESSATSSAALEKLNSEYESLMEKARKNENK